MAGFVKGTFVAVYVVSGSTEPFAVHAGCFERGLPGSHVARRGRRSCCVRVRLCEARNQHTQAVRRDSFHFAAQSLSPCKRIMLLPRVASICKSFPRKFLVASSPFVLVLLAMSIHPPPLITTCWTRETLGSASSEAFASRGKLQPRGRRLVQVSLSPPAPCLDSSPC